MEHPSEAPGRARSAGRGASWALAVASLTLVLGIAEIGFRLAGYSALHDIYSKPSLFWIHDELLGWSHQPNAEGTYVGPRPFPVEFETPIRINSIGLRGPELAPKQPGEYRVLVLGDSVTVGFEVAYRDTYPAQLEGLASRRLGAPVRVINAAVRAYGTDQHYLYYRERGYALRPDLVLLQYSTNDANDNLTLHRMKRPFGKPALVPRADGSLALVGHPVPRYPLCSAFMLNAGLAAERVDGLLNRALCLAQVQAADRSAVFSFVSRALARLPWLVRGLKEEVFPASQQGPALGAAATGHSMAGVLAAPASGPDLEDLERRVTSAIVLELARTVRDHGSELMVFIKPGDLEALDRERLEPHVDFRSVPLPSHLDERQLRFVNDSHFNERGHRIIARGLARPVVEYARRRIGGLSSGSEAEGPTEE